VLAPVITFAPEVAIPLAAMGVASGIDEISRGNIATGTFDIGVSFLMVRGARMSPNWRAPLSTRVANTKLLISRSGLNYEEAVLNFRMRLTSNRETRAGILREITNVRTARGILDDPNIIVNRYDSFTRTVDDVPLGLDPNSSLEWNGLRINQEFYRPNGERAGDLDISFRDFDVEIKAGARASDIAGKVNARNTHLPERGGLPYYIGSRLPPDVLARWAQYPRAIPGDMRNATANGYDGHIQITENMFSGRPFLFEDMLNPQNLRFLTPLRLPSGKK